MNANGQTGRTGAIISAPTLLLAIAATMIMAILMPRESGEATAQEPVATTGQDVLVRTEPADGSFLSVQPREVRVILRGRFTLQESGIYVYGPDGVAVNDGPTRLERDGRTFVVPIQKGLENGRYTVDWVAVSSLDGLTKEGSFDFGFRRGARPPTLELDRSVVPAGARLTVTGMGFKPTSTVAIAAADGKDAVDTVRAATAPRAVATRSNRFTRVDNVRARSFGQFTYTIQIPTDLPFGVLTIAAADEEGAVATAEVQVGWPTPTPLFADLRPTATPIAASGTAANGSTSSGITASGSTASGAASSGAAPDAIPQPANGPSATTASAAVRSMAAATGSAASTAASGGTSPSAGSGSGSSSAASGVPSSCSSAPSLSFANTRASGRVSLRTDSFLLWRVQGLKPGTIARVAIHGPTSMGASDGPLLVSLDAEPVTDTCEAQKELKGSEVTANPAVGSDQYVLVVTGIPNSGGPHREIKLAAPFYLSHTPR